MILILAICGITQTIRDNYILVVIVLLITNHTLLSLYHIMPSVNRCPACDSEDIIDYGDLIECGRCGLEFFKESIESDIDEENLLSEQELKAFAKAFDDEEKKKLLGSREKDCY